MGAVDIGELRGLISLQDAFSKPITDAAKGVGVFTESFGAIAGATTAMGAAAGAIVALGQRGATVNDVKEHFNNLTASAGQSADVMLGELQRGTLNTISNFDLMQK